MSIDYKDYGFIRITSPYGWRKNPSGANNKEWHKGIDLIKNHKSPIHAFIGGTVRHAKEGVPNSGLGNYGLTVVIEDNKGSYHLYAHLDSLCVSVGQSVKLGQQVGTQGNTGMSFGSHLHYEIRLKKAPSFGLGSDTDPTQYLNDWFKVNQEPTKVPVYVENEKCSDGLLIDNVTFVNVRDLAEAYGGKLEWKDKILKVNGTIIGSARLINNSNYAPVRDIAAILKATVQLNGKEVKVHK
ncbi:peptidoglycan DD-metalloendopeptidase family protein [Paenibacillus sp. NAIST15-1]|uniref:peptidoglycan DD-metalloendopeptidase family protein n=1 Tax=Paenibacillus sp. NAIST15-1 TaxID=1605994 RepID=UPI000869FFE9|nr:peptidoglycan DD-metalloendopeptidase family protein [Paenibacillus sp. NAIST15-1]GAV11272.1 muramidase [Paenibacillus sp. NAIST15-1]